MPNSCQSSSVDLLLRVDNHVLILLDLGNIFTYLLMDLKCRSRVDIEKWCEMGMFVLLSSLQYVHPDELTISLFCLYEFLVIYVWCGWYCLAKHCICVISYFSSCIITCFWHTQWRAGPTPRFGWQSLAIALILIPLLLFSNTMFFFWWIPRATSPSPPLPSARHWSIFRNWYYFIFRNTLCFSQVDSQCPISTSAVISLASVEERLTVRISPNVMAMGADGQSVHAVLATIKQGRLSDTPDVSFRW